MIGRIVCALGLVLLVSACMQPVDGAPVAAEGPAAETTTAVDDFPTESTEPTGPTRPRSSSSSPTTTRTSSNTDVTITNRKTISTPPACATLVTPAQIGQLTGTTATPEPEDKGFCSYTLARPSGPAGITLVVLTSALDTQNTEETTFEGNTAHRLSTQATTCDIRVALTDDRTSPYRVLWVSIVLSAPAEPLCSTVEKLAKSVFDKLPSS
ncbi:hypothetical protein JOF56_011335 [Kibdelosporangium banguiense]|uniref:DUF3558 domain-containing protein n=1 Tax=Kibdelosporangium banguiense TaxID=1365924 RepID=A0ABS4U431_9PSEU|nr:hypothetical protein [Kibdelosporangium banguiense]MBP2330950.1 hypothetical protein [Kibdelosporangium banguiense]